jgi:predicted nucleic acid-binding Zn ribbon protein
VYRFVETGETIEIQQSFDDPTLTETTHPVTGATMTVKKVFQPVGVTFKGSGFYKTDSRGGSKSSSTASPTSSSTENTKSEGSSSASSSDSTKTASTSSTSSD